MTRDEAIAALLARPKFGTGPGVERLSAATRALPPTPWFGSGAALHVTGSHGKGTVATLTAALLAANGVRTGLFISPHLHRFEERIQINGVPIGGEGLAAAYRAYAEAERRVPTGADRFGAFEAITGTALFAFAAAGLDTVVLEAGIGGRLDSTRVAGGALVALTGIDREHLDLLGPTEDDVLREKADLCPPGGTLLAGSLAPPLRATLERHAAARAVKVRFVDDETRIGALHPSVNGLVADVQVGDLAWDRLETRLFGPAQLGNAALALAVARAWLARFGVFDAQRFQGAARSVFARTPLPLRFQRLGTAPPVFADVAHTPAALRALADTVRLHTGARKIVIVLGVSEGKAPAELAAGLLPVAGHVICSAAGHRALAADRVAAALAPAFQGIPIETYPALGEALARAQTLARVQGTAVLATGSLFLARDVARLLSGCDGAADPSL